MTCDLSTLPLQATMHVLPMGMSCPWACPAPGHVLTARVCVCALCVPCSDIFRKGKHQKEHDEQHYKGHARKNKPVPKHA